MENPNIWNTPIKTSLSGYWGGSLADIGLDGYFWSPMVNDSGLSYYLYVGLGGVYPDDRFVRGDGISVRCLAR